MRVWVNFKELRSNLRFEDVLRHFNVEVRPKGEQHQGYCPLPGHQGKRNSPSFSANLEKGIFQCFGCGAKGNLLEFACLMSGVDPNDSDAFRSVAVELQRKFLPQGTSSRKKTGPTDSPVTEGVSKPVVVNAPLDFALKDLDAGHPYLEGRKFTRETMHHFGVGFCSRGMLKDRIAIPLHDSEGKVIGYAGRVIDDATITDDSPRYRLPSRRERGGRIYEVRKGLFLYNGFRLKTSDRPLVVVEGFPSVWWLTQNGFPRTAATMGSDCSDEQIDLMVQTVPPDGEIWVMPDGDKAGIRFAESVLPRLACRRFVRWAKLDDGKQPTDLSAHELKACLSC